MSEEVKETNVVENKETNQGTNNGQSPQAQSNAVSKVQEAQPIPETQEQINWKRFREAREQERKQKEAAEKDAAKKAEEISALKAAMESLLNKPSSVQNQAGTQDSGDESEDQRIQKKVEEALTQRDRQYEQQRIANEQRELPQRLAQSFPDFDQVCSTENLDYLEFHKPKIAAAFKKSPDDFDKWAGIYDAIKSFVPNPQSQKDAKKADKNSNRPQSMAIGGTTQTTDTPPMVMTEQRRKDNYSRMQRVMRGGS